MLFKLALATLCGLAAAQSNQPSGTPATAASMVPASMTPGSMTPGSMTPGSMTPGSMTPGSMTPGSMTPGSMTPGTPAPTPPPTDPDTTVVGVAVSTGQFPTLVAALTAAGLVTALQEAPAVTVFAPSENAFGALPPGAVGYLLRNVGLLTDVLLYHVVGGVVQSSSVTDGMVADTLLTGAQLAFAVAEDGTVTINEGAATVVAADIPASNGVIHVINGVLIPPGFPPLPPGLFGALNSPEIGGMASTLIAALEATGLDQALIGEDAFTVFVPTDSAFEALSPGTLNSWLSDADTLFKVLTYHVVPGVFDEATIAAGATELSTIEGSDLTITIEAGTAMIGSATIVQTDVIALNGVIHLVDGVLIPPSVTVLPGIAEAAIATGLFQILFQAIQLANLDVFLDVEAVFGPTDAALAGITPSDLVANPLFVDILLGHVVAQALTAADLTDGMMLTALGSSTLCVSIADGVVKINNAVVTNPDILGSNGVVHGIDALIDADYTLPPMPTEAPVMPPTTPAPASDPPTEAPEPVDTVTPSIAPTDSSACKFLLSSTTSLVAFGSALFAMVMTI